MNAQKKNGYLLLSRSDEWYKQLSHEEIQKVMNQAKAWFDGLAAQGKVKGGQALAREGAIVSSRNGRVITDGPFAESKEIIGGYLLLEVATLEEAIAISRTCPTLAYGTSIEIRPIAEECPLDTCARGKEQEQLAVV